MRHNKGTYWGRRLSVDERVDGGFVIGMLQEKALPLEGRLSREGKGEEGVSLPPSKQGRKFENVEGEMDHG